MKVKEIEAELLNLKNLQLSQCSMIEYWTNKLAKTNFHILNLEIDLIFENSKKTNP
jgi:hypothetical protein